MLANWHQGHVFGGVCPFLAIYYIFYGAVVGGHMGYIARDLDVPQPNPVELRGCKNQTLMQLWLAHGRLIFAPAPGQRFLMAHCHVPHLLWGLWFHPTGLILVSARELHAKISPRKQEHGGFVALTTKLAHTPTSGAQIDQPT